jgi:hypothetical protein
VLSLFISLLSSHRAREIETSDVYTDVRLFAFASKSLINNSKFVESALRRDVNGLWIYETTNVDLAADDSIEYWLYVERHKLGHFVSDVLRVEGECGATFG